MPASAPPSHPVKRNRAELMARWQWAIGLSITAVILLVEWLGFATPAEYPFLDWRARYFSFFKGEPSGEIALIAIDDPSQETVGKWPWPRERLAQVIRELHLAGAKVIALDLLLSNPQQPRLIGDPAHPESIRMVDGDAELAAAIKEHGRVVLGASFQIRGTEDRAALPSAQHSSTTAGEDASYKPEKVPFPIVFDDVNQDPDLTFEAIKHKRLSAGEAATTSGASVDDLRLKYEWARILRDRQYEFSVPGAASSLKCPQSDDPEPPAPPLLAATARLASVSFGKEDLDGGVRRIPLWVRSGARLYPTLGLSAAALYLGIPIESIEVRGETETQLTNNLKLGMHTALLTGLGPVEGLHYINWPTGGTRGWRHQFVVKESTVVPEGSDRMIDREISIGSILNPYLVYDRIAQNIASLDEQIARVERNYGSGFVNMADYAARAAEMSRLTPDDARWKELYAAQGAAWGKIASEAASLLEMFPPEADRTPEENAQFRDMAAVTATVPDLIKRIDSGIDEVKKWRGGELRKRVQGKLCLVGWTATGALADFVRTSVDPRTPGMHIHACVMNSILTDAQYQVGVPSLLVINYVSVLVVGVLATLIGVRFPVLVGPVALVAMLAGWSAVNGILFWDKDMWIVSAATPLAAGVFPWLAVTLHRLLVEQRGRKQTEARFRSYVSPDVVDILVNNPGLGSMAPQKREMTMLFSDIAGFTTISERLETEQLAHMLNTYLGAMTDILQNERGTIDKYLGDGIMVFWGAPLDDPQHARHAAFAASRMLEKLDEMNATNAFGPAGQLVTRIGIATGEVNVGDFGNPPAKSAYTVIGDAVNLAARLESANKFFGTRILITDRVRELSGNDQRCRLVGRIIVKGKSEYQTLYELIGTRNPHGSRTEAWISVTEKAVSAFIRGDLAEAQERFAQLEHEFADSVLVGVYSRAIQSILSEGGVPDGFLGAITLSDK